MFGTTFYHGTLKKYVILFGTLFNDVWINRTSSSGSVKQSFKVPISYSPRDKMLARIAGDPDLDREFAIVLPRMGFEFTSFAYAAERKLPTINKYVTAERSNDNKSYQYNPVPYDIGFNLSIFVKNTEDGTAIIEQILPYFTPEWNTTVQFVTDPNIIIDVPLVIQGVSMDDAFEGDFNERRAIIWSIDFIMKGLIFSPTKQSGIIKLANVNMHDATLFNPITDAIGVTEPIARVSTYPGQDANGAATSNASIAIANTDSIDQDEDWDYVVTVDDPLQEE